MIQKLKNPWPWMDTPESGRQFLIFLTGFTITFVLTVGVLWLMGAW